MSRSSRPPAPGPLLRHPDQLSPPKVRSEQARRLWGARVVYADYDLLQHDFPQLRQAAMLKAHPELATSDAQERRRRVRRRIDRWLLRHGALISQAQASQQEVNSPIACDGRVEAFRPARYGRALVSRVDDDGGLETEGRGAGLLDLKGVGVAPDKKPSHRVMGSGLMYLGEALADLMMQRLIEEILHHAGSPCTALPLYAVLDAGFDCRAKGVAVPAGIQIRRSHLRPQSGNDLPRPGSPKQRIILDVEWLLRRYGVTSCNAHSRYRLVERDGSEVMLYSTVTETQYWSLEEQLAAYRKHVGPDGPRVADGVNVQLTGELTINPERPQLVDFGHYRVQPFFPYPLVSLVRQRVIRWGGMTLPDSPDFVQPDPELQVPEEDWGMAPDPDEALGVDVPQSPTRYRIHAYRLAREIRAGRVSRQALRAALEEPVAKAVRRWPTRAQMHSAGAARDRSLLPRAAGSPSAPLPPKARE